MINIAQLAEKIGKFSGLIAFLFTAFSYGYNLKVERDRKRYDFSIEILKEYSANIRMKEQKLEYRLLYYNEYSDINDKSVFSDKSFKLVAEEILFDYNPDKKIEEQNKKSGINDILDVSDFYERSFFCINQNICDVEIVAEFLCPRALSFYTKNKRLLQFYANLSSKEGASYDFSSLRKLCASKITAIE